MGLSSPGIGSNLDVNGIVSKLMTVEQQPLTLLAQKEASYQARISAFGNLTGSLSSFQSAVAALSTTDKFQAISASVSDLNVLTSTATNKAVAGTYNINVSQLARAQTLTGAGQASATAAIGVGTLSFQFGTISGGSYVSSGTILPSNVAAGGIAANSLSINGSTIVTSGTTNNAKDLASQINLLTATTGVTAVAQTTDTGALAFTDVSTGVGDSYSLQVGTTTLANIGASTTFTKLDLDNAVTANAASLTAAGITVTGSAVGNNLHFTKADGTNFNITQTIGNTSGTATGGIAGLTSGTAKTYTSAVTLNSANAITVGGNNPSSAGLYTGILPNTYSGANFTQDPTQATGTITIDSTNNSLQGIRDAINAAAFGVTATIVNDGGATPNHLVLTSNRTGAVSSMKISVTGDAALNNVLGYDPAGTQHLTQSTEAKNTLLTVNGIAVNSATQTVTDAVQGTVFTIKGLGSSTLTVAKDTGSVQSAVNSFVSAYNSLGKTLKSLTSYDAATQKGGLLLGDTTTRQIDFQIKSMVSASLKGLSGNLTNLSQIGISIDKTGTMTLDSGKLQTAITNNFSDIGALFSTMGTSSDSLVSFVGSTLATKPGNNAITVTQLATKGALVGTVNLNTASTVIASGTTLSTTLDGTTANVTLLAGTYTATQLAAMVQSAINGTPAFSALSSGVTATIDSNGFLNLQSNRYGSTSTVSLTNGTGTTAATLVGASPVSSTGVDVAGTIGDRAATGSGQNLTGAVGTDMEGLKVLVSGGALGARGTINFSQGYATQLKQLIDGYVGTNGLITANTNGISNTIKDIGKQRTAVNEHLVAIEARYRAQFTALDTLISSMNATQTYLTQQLASIANLSKQ